MKWNETRVNFSERTSDVFPPTPQYSFCVTRLVLPSSQWRPKCVTAKIIKHSPRKIEYRLRSQPLRSETKLLITSRQTSDQIIALLDLSALTTLSVNWCQHTAVAGKVCWSLIAQQVVFRDRDFPYKRRSVRWPNRYVIVFQIVHSLTVTAYFQSFSFECVDYLACP